MNILTKQRTPDKKKHLSLFRIALAYCVYNRACGLALCWEFAVGLETWNSFHFRMFDPILQISLDFRLLLMYLCWSVPFSISLTADERSEKPCGVFEGEMQHAGSWTGWSEELVKQHGSGISPLSGSNTLGEYFPSYFLRCLNCFVFFESNLCV